MQPRTSRLRTHRSHPARLTGLTGLTCLISLILPAGARACTIGAFSPLSTRTGAPILWKNRDVDNPDQEMRFFADGRFRFIANVYAGESANVWAGINEVGFGIMNSNSYNLSGKKRKAADDGNVMHLALANCASLEDFTRLMDSLNVVGRTTPANYGVFDSTGATAIFEASNTYYKVCDAAFDSHNFTLRANYSFSGDSLRLRGRNRWLRAMQLSIPARRNNAITPEWVVQTLCRDLGQVGFNPYPLPFPGRYGTLEPGYLPTESTISRHTTRSVEIMVGRQLGCPVGSSMMWVLLGSPDVALPVPLWVAAGKVPTALDGPVRSAICDEAARVHSYIHSDPKHPAAVNTRALAHVQNFFAPVESTIFAIVESAATSWLDRSPLPEQASALSDTVCEMVLSAYVRFWETLEQEKPLPLWPGRVVTAGRGSEVLFQLPKGFSIRQLRIYDITGQQKARIAILPGQKIVRCDLSPLAGGTYFIFAAGKGLQLLSRLNYLR